MISEVRFNGYASADVAKKTIVSRNHLRGNNTKSCGCLYNEGNNTKHGHTKNNKLSKTYESWAHIVQRCTNPNNKFYHNYGDRGIKVCKRWMKFENFLEDMGEPPTQEHSIDRINNDGNYCKENCRWATRKEQQRNRRNNIFVTYKNKTQLLVEWAEQLGIDYDVLRWRLNHGWSVEKAFTTPVKSHVGMLLL